MSLLKAAGSGLRRFLLRIDLPKVFEGSAEACCEGVLHREKAAQAHCKYPAVQYSDCGQLYYLPGLEGIDFPVTHVQRRKGGILSFSSSLAGLVRYRRLAQPKESSPEREVSP